MLILTHNDGGSCVSSVLFQVRQSPTNVFLASLASADLLLILICLPLKVNERLMLICAIVILSLRWGSCSPMFGSLAGWSVSWLITLRPSQSSAPSLTSQRSVWRGGAWSETINIIIQFISNGEIFISLDHTLYARHTILVLMRFTTIKQGLSYKFIPI